MEYYDHMTAMEYFGRAWAGAKNTLSYLTVKDVEEIFEHLDEMYNGDISLTQINDIFWFETDYIAQCLGYEDFEDLIEKRKEEE